VTARWTPESFQAWWGILLSAIRDIAALTVGVWILLFRQDAPVTLEILAFLLLTASTAGAAKSALRIFGPPNGEGR
jgi:hypothetical protein